MNKSEHQTSSGKRHVPFERLRDYTPDVEQRVQAWFSSAEPLVWIPILSEENFPGVPHQFLQFAEYYLDAMRRRIDQIDDLLQLPNGITGWLMPATATDTDVACGRWEGEIFILGIKDRRTGKRQTLLGERVDGPSGQADKPNQSAV